MDESQLGGVGDLIVSFGGQKELFVALFYMFGFAHSTKERSLLEFRLNKLNRT